MNNLPYSSDRIVLPRRAGLGAFKVWGLLLYVALSTLPAAPHAVASSADPGKVIAGWVEKITVIEGGQVVKAKLDTGAKTSSIYAVNVEVFKRDEKSWVRFDLVLDTQDGPNRITLERPRVRRVSIKDHGGENDRRPVVELDICFDGRYHTVQFNLSDRGQFIYPVLLGRKFLAGIAVIDPEQTFLTQAHCEPRTEQSK